MRVSGALTTALKVRLQGWSRSRTITLRRNDNHHIVLKPAPSPEAPRRPCVLILDTLSSRPSLSLDLREPGSRSFSFPGRRAVNSSSSSRAPPRRAAKTRFALFSLKPHLTAAVLSSRPVVRPCYLGPLSWPVGDLSFTSTPRRSSGLPTSTTHGQSTR